MSTKINLKKKVQHKLGNQPLPSSEELPTPAISNKFLHKTIHAAGHDLRSPLFIIRSYSQLLQKTQEQQVLYRGLQLVDDATQRMEKTINELVGLLDIYTLPFPQKNMVLLEAALETAQFQLVKLIHKHQPTFSFDFTDFPTVAFNEKYLVDLLTCLLDNAIRHNKDITLLEIHVSSQKVGDDLILIVQDNGNGIVEDTTKVKEPFYTHTKEEEPTCVGMGLAKVQAIAQVSGSTFSLASSEGMTEGRFVFGSEA